MKKRKIKKIWAIVVVTISILLFALAFYVAPEWNNKKVNSGSEIDKVIAELEISAQNDATVSELLTMLKNYKNNGELSTYSMYPRMTPTPTPTQTPAPNPTPTPIPTPNQNCKKIGIAKDGEMCGYGLIEMFPCGNCLTCTKQITHQMIMPPYTTMKFLVCEYKTESIKDKCDNNCPAPSGKGYEKLCSKMVQTFVPAAPGTKPIISNPSCSSSCKDDTACTGGKKCKEVVNKQTSGRTTIVTTYDPPIKSCQ